MRISRTIEPARFLDAFQKVGWKNEISSTKRYYIWTDPSNQDIWTRLPVDVKDPDYMRCQEKNILFLLYALDLPENIESQSEILSQLKAYNYKLINRIVGRNGSADTIPYELATLVPEKNIDAFRYFCHTRKDRKRVMPIEKFELNHTEVGSFVIPVSLIVDEDPNASLMPKQSDISILLHEYLKALDDLMKTPRKSAENFAERVMSESIDSRIVKDFLSKDGGIAKLSQKYKERVKAIVIGSKANPLLDFKLDQEVRQFKDVEIAEVQPLDEEYVKALEDLEVRSDNSSIDESRAKIEVIVDTIDRSGKARFTVVAINGEEIKKPFKASTAELAKNKLDECARHFAKDDILVVSGDIKKSKGKLGKILVDSFDIVEAEAPDNQANLF